MITSKIIKVETVTVDNTTGKIACPEPSSQEKLMDSIFGENRKWVPVQLYTCLGTVKAKNKRELAENGFRIAELNNYCDIEFFILK